MPSVSPFVNRLTKSSPQAIRVAARQHAGFDISQLSLTPRRILTEKPWKAILDRLREPYYLSTIDHVRKIRDRKQRMDIRKYCFVNRTITNWNQLPAEALGTFPCEPEIFRSRVVKAVINGVK
jgi:hypothetical protein